MKSFQFSTIEGTVNQTSFNMPEDMEFEILLCLPVKSLLRFKCVSKSWYNLIKSPTFIHSHLRKQEEKDGVLLLKRMLYSTNKQVLSFHDLDPPKLEDESLNLSFPDYLKTFRLMDSSPCNGVICLVKGSRFLYREERTHEAVLCNPALREFKVLPQCPFLEELCNRPKFVYTRWGFGKTSTDSFKVVLITFTLSMNNHGSLEAQVEACVYDWATNAWKQGNGMYKVLACFHCTQPYTFMNGTCHWSSYRLFKTDPPSVILTFDVSTEVFGELEYPDYLPKIKEECFFMKVMNQCLAIVCCGGEFKDGQRITEVWMMKEYGVKESWTKQFVIGHQILLRPLSFYKNDHPMSLLIQIGDQLMISHEYHEYHTNNIKEGSWFDWALIYKESLISLYNISK